MRSLRWLAAATAALGLVVVGGAASQSLVTAPEPLAPSAGQSFKAGTRIAFRVSAQIAPTDAARLFLLVSRSPAVKKTCGTIGGDVQLYGFKATSTPNVFESRPPYYSFASFWMNTPGVYYWQAYVIDYTGGADGCIESRVSSFVIQGKAPSPTPSPTPTPSPSPSPGLPISRARLAGGFKVVTRVTAASGVDVRVGYADRGTWVFRPKCATGPCNTQVSFNYTGASFDEHFLTLRLHRTGNAYKGVGTAKFLECFYKDVPGPITVQLRVTQAAWIDGRWRATKVVGTYVHTTSSATSGIYRCAPSTIRATVTGTLPR
jgi:hypothetical protein